MSYEARVNRLCTILCLTDGWTVGEVQTLREVLLMPSPSGSAAASLAAFERILNLNQEGTDDQT